MPSDKINGLRVLGLMLVASLAFETLNPHRVMGQTRDEKVLRDRAALADDDAWFYDDLEKGMEAAVAAGKPLMVVLRCIP